MFVIDANLDAEARWAGGELPAHVAARVSPFASLCAALAPEGERVEVWAPAEVERSRLAAPAGWRPPAMRVGTPAHADLVWAAADAKPVNDRRFALAVAEAAGCALAGARVVGSVDELAAHLAAGGARASASGEWVCKAPWTSAGRDRAFGAGGAIDDQVRGPLSKLFAAHGALMFEPWLERLVDVAMCGHVTAAGVDLLPPHRLVTSRRGTFVGIQLGPIIAEPGLQIGEHDQLVLMAEQVGVALGRAGYAGPFGIDAFVYVADGQRRLHPLCEINARFTFGHVAHALANRLDARTLGFGAIAPEGAIVLVEPGHAGAWITVRA